MRVLIGSLYTVSSLYLRRSLPSRVLCRVAATRLYSSARSPSPTYVEETVEIPIGSDGQLSLSILQPTLLPGPRRPNVILYLPAGPLFQPDNSSDGKGISGNNGLIEYRPESSLLSPQHVLASTTLSTVVTVNYRLGRVVSANAPVPTGEPQDSIIQPSQIYKYPTPVHDTLAGFDWVLQNLDPEKLCVFGTHVGGSLAVMLALTEPRSIQAIAASEPVCDWVGLDEYCTILPEGGDLTVAVGNKGGTELDEPQEARKTSRKRRNRSSAPRDLVPLLNAREEFFHKPEKYFDSFASPILFLRSAGRDVPKAFPKYFTGPDYPFPVLKKSEKEEEQLDFWDIHLQAEEAGAASPSPSGSDADPTAEMVPVRRRKALSRWPPYGLDYGLSAASGPSSSISRLQVTLPCVRLFVHSSHVSEPEEVLFDFEDLDLDDDSASIQGNGDRKGRHGHRTKGKDETVLERQATEMVSVMRRACFFGREKGFGQNRVKLIRVPGPGASASDGEFATTVEKELSVEEEAGKWLRGILDDTAEE